MKIIYPNITKLFDVGPAETYASFPLQNVLDPHILKKWKADSSIINSISINIDATSSVHDSVALFGLVADSVTIEVYSDQAMTAPNLLETTATKTLKITDRFGLKQIKNVWFDLNSRAASYIKVILNTTNTLDVNIGVVSVGERVSFNNPIWGAAIALKDHSIIKQLKNGSNFKRKKTTSKLLNCTLELPTTQDGIDQYNELIRLFNIANAEDFALIWVDNLKDPAGNPLDDDYLIWGSFGTEFNPTRGKYSLSTIKFSIREGI